MTPKQLKAIKKQTESHSTFPVAVVEELLEHIKELQIDDIARVIASYYGFNITRDAVSRELIIEDSGQNCSFYWSSHRSLGIFLDNLKEFFMDMGMKE